MFVVAPGPVAILQNDSSTETCITLSWTFGFDGNSPITGVDISYTATVNQSPEHNGSTSTSSVETTSIQICGLQPLTTYQFSVTVRNEVSGTVGVSSAEVISADTLPNGQLAVSIQYIVQCTVIAASNGVWWVWLGHGCECIILFISSKHQYSVCTHFITGLYPEFHNQYNS